MSTLMPVRTLYLDRPALSETPACVIATGQMLIKGKKYHWIRLDQTIFYPEGGGQPADKGTINDIPVDFLKKVRLGGQKALFDIQHCFLKPVHFGIREIVMLKIDGDLRQLHMRMHTAGCLIIHLIQQTFASPAFKGINHSPGNGSIQFQHNQPGFTDVKGLEIFLTHSIEDRKGRGIPVNTMVEEGIRMVQIENSKIHCEGTHLNNLSEIGPLKIGPITLNKEDETITIQYDVLRY